MNDPRDPRAPTAHLKRWVAAEAGGYRREADRSLRGLFRSVPHQAPSPGFTERVVAAATAPAGLFQRPWVRSTLAALFVTIAGVLAVVEATVLVAGANLGLDGLAAAATRLAMGSFEAVDVIAAAIDRLTPVGRLLIRTAQAPQTLIGLSATVVVALAAFRVLAEFTAHLEEPQHVDSAR